MRDSVLTIAIGRNNSEGELSVESWGSFRTEIRDLLDKYATLVANTSGRGVASDEDREGKPEDSAVFVAINPKRVNYLRKSVAHVLERYKQTSAAFSLDTSHEPCFATPNGLRG